MAKSILGVHHVTAIAGDPDPNLDFDTRVPGLRLVKITVNFDDPASYHLYYGDSSGHPGAILNFFCGPACAAAASATTRLRQHRLPSRPVRVNTGTRGFERTARNSRSRGNVSAKVPSHSEIGAKHLTSHW
jgi:catechol 2,3-dioxygenase-like lactoylglutathione lyase family enzyme